MHEYTSDICLRSYIIIEYYIFLLKISITFNLFILNKIIKFQHIIIFLKYICNILNTYICIYKDLKIDSVPIILLFIFIESELKVTFCFNDCACVQTDIFYRQRQGIN